VTTMPAVGPGTDLSRHARDLARVHDAVVTGAAPPAQPRPLVARSWSRVMRLGLDPQGTARSPLSWAELERRRAASPLAPVVDELRAVLSAAADATPFLVVIADADGVVLWRDGAVRVRQRADALGFTEATVWSEAEVGTNAIGTALVEGAPVQLFSAEHYEKDQHPWYCTAAPVTDPRTGEVLGVVDVSGPAMSLHPAVTALVETAVRLGEARLLQLHAARLERLRQSSEHLLVGVRGPHLLVDDAGWVAARSGVAARARIAAPRSDRALAVPGLGLCLPERVADGWLVRPVAGASASPRLVARLHLTGAPLLELEGAGEPWRTPLSRRHADLLARVEAAGPAGVTAGQLSTALYGDADHAVTVRPEFSRLRRVVGALVDTSPYRLAEGVVLTVVGREPSA
jgi:hypothetical protein